MRNNINKEVIWFLVALLFNTVVVFAILANPHAWLLNLLVIGLIISGALSNYQKTIILSIVSLMYTISIGYYIDSFTNLQQSLSATTIIFASFFSVIIAILIKNYKTRILMKDLEKDIGLLLNKEDNFETLIKEFFNILVNNFDFKIYGFYFNNFKENNNELELYDFYYKGLDDKIKNSSQKFQEIGEYKIPKEKLENLFSNKPQQPINIKIFKNFKYLKYLFNVEFKKDFTDKNLKSSYVVYGNTDLPFLVNFYDNKLSLDSSMDSFFIQIFSQLNQVIERNYNKNKLTEQEALKSAILKSSVDAIISFDNNGAIIEFNPAAEKMFGLTNNIAKEKNIIDLFKYNQEDIFSQYLINKDFDSLLNNKYETRALYFSYSNSKINETFPIEVAITNIESNVIKYTMFAKDITSLHKNRDRQELLLQATTNLTSNLDFDTTLDNLAHLLVPNIADWCSIDIVDEETDEIKHLNTYHIISEKEKIIKELRREHPYHLTDDPISGIRKVLSTKKPLFIPIIDIKDSLKRSIDKEHKISIAFLNTKSLIIVPMIKSNGNILGALTVARSENDISFNQEELKLVEELTQKAAIAIDNALLYRKITKRTQQLKIANKQREIILEGIADGVIAQDLNANVIFSNQAALKILQLDNLEELQLLDYNKPFSKIEVLDEQGNSLSLSEIFSNPYPLTSQLEDVNENKEILLDNINDNILEEIEEVIYDTTLKENDKTVQIISKNPIKDNIEQWIIIKSRPIKAEEQDLLITIFEDITQQRNQERSQKVLAKTGEKLTSTLKFENVLQEICEIPINQLADYVVVYFNDIEENIQYLKYSSNIEYNDKWSFFLDNYKEILTRRKLYDDKIFEEQNAVWITKDNIEFVEDLEVKEHISKHFFDNLNMESFTSVPLKIKNRNQGTLLLISAKKTTFQSNEDLILSQTIAQRFSVAIENAMLYRDKFTVAETMQKSLLPEQPPKIPLTEISTKYIPAKTREDVGGDFYDFFNYNENTWFMVVGDVCGKGVEAASLTSLAKYTLRSSIAFYDDPIKMLEHLNQALIWQTDVDKFLTCMLTKIEVKDSHLKLTMSNAGHPSAYLIEDKGIKEITNKGALLGIMEDIELSSTVLDLDYTQKLIMYTDGISEARKSINGKSQFLDVEKVLLDNKELNVYNLTDKLANTAIEYQGNKASDDIAIVALSVKEPLVKYYKYKNEAESVTKLRHKLLDLNLPIKEKELFQIELLLSELATNAVKYSKGEYFEVKFIYTDTKIRIEVYNYGNELDFNAHCFLPSNNATGGRGLWLVNELSDNSGSNYKDGQCKVWFETFLNKK